jgi:hypothetical protein
VQFEALSSGTSLRSTTVITAAPVTAVAGDLYLAAVSTKSHVNVTAVSGLGLTWTPVVSRCGARSQTGVAVWKAQGNPTGTGTVQATLASAPSSAVIVVSRYSGAGSMGSTTSANTLGVQGACTGGTDNTSYSFNVTTGANEAVVFTAAAMRSRTHTPSAAYTERAEVRTGTGGNDSSVAVSDRKIVTPSVSTVSGSFSGTIDWAVAVVEIQPAFTTTSSTSTTSTLPPTTTSSTSTTTSSTSTTSTLPPPSGDVQFAALTSGTSLGSTTVATATPVTAVAGNLYLAAVATKTHVSVTGVSGLGLTWTPVVSRCGARSQTGVAVWKAQGNPTGNGTVQATLASAPSTAVIAVSRYSGVASLGNTTSANTLGIQGACTGGTDNTSYSFNVATGANEAVVFTAAAMRSRTHTPSATYTERAEIRTGTGSNDSSVAISDRKIATPSVSAVSGSFSTTVDWAVAVVEIRP